MPDEASIPAIGVEVDSVADYSLNNTVDGNLSNLIRRDESAGTYDSIQADLIRLSGVIMALIGAFCVAVALIIIRKLKGKSNPLNVVFYFHWMLIPFAILFAPLVPKTMDTSSWIIPQKWETWGLAVLGSLFGTMSQIFITKGLQTETAATASSMNYTQVIFAFTGEWLVWGDIPTPMTIFGCGIIIGSMLFAAIYKNRFTR